MAQLKSTDEFNHFLTNIGTVVSYPKETTSHRVQSLDNAMCLAKGVTNV